MTLKINTQRGILKYKFQVIYEGVKIMDKKIARENLLLFKQLADKAGLKFGLMYGTLLGAIREHDFIAHDEDIDLFILKEDIEAFKNLLWDLREAGFEIMRFDRRNSLCSIIRKNEYIDIYIFRELCPGIREFNGECVLEQYLTDLSEITFQGEQFLAATDAADFCLFEYGANWQTPIVMKPYDRGWIQKKKAQLYWYLHFNLPEFLFRKYAIKKAEDQLRRFNAKVERFNQNQGTPLLHPLPNTHYELSY